MADTPTTRHNTPHIDDLAEEVAATALHRYKEYVDHSDTELSLALQAGIIVQLGRIAETLDLIHGELMKRGGST